MTLLDRFSEKIPRAERSSYCFRKSGGRSSFDNYRLLVRNILDA